MLSLRVAEFVDSDGHYAAGAPDPVAATLWRDGKLLAELPNAWQDVVTTPGDGRLQAAAHHAARWCGVALRHAYGDRVDVPLGGARTAAAAARRL